nr:essential MCU regulator, mitochondrial [Aotus nancymaae]
MASGAARWLALAAVRSGVFRSGPSLRKGGDVAAARSDPSRSLVPSRSVIVTRSGAILPKPVKVSVFLETGRRG